MEKGYNINLDNEIIIIKNIVGADLRVGPNNVLIKNKIMKIKVVFDKKGDSEYFGGWGLSYLIDEKTLFDTGEKSEYTLKNLETLKVSPKDLKRIIISHNHWNHLGGFWNLLNINKNMEIFACSDFEREFKDKLNFYNFKTISKFSRICDNIYTTGAFKVQGKGKGLEEQALLLKTDKGISILCGCSHPGVLKFIDKAKEEFPQDKIYSVLGGFHYLDKEDRVIRYLVEEIKKAGVENVGPSHCTGFEAENIFKQVYQKNFWDIKVGREIEI